MAEVKDRPKDERRQKIFLKSGEELTPELEEELAAEAERGYDLSEAKWRFLRQPLLADGETKPTISFSVSVAELNAARQRAEDEDRTLADLARAALRRYMDTDS
jgi:hypothetical protein